MESDARLRADAYGGLAASLKQLPRPVSEVEEVAEWIASIEYVARFHEMAAQAADSRDLDGYSAAVRSIDGEMDVARWKGPEYRTPEETFWQAQRRRSLVWARSRDKLRP